MRFKTCNIDQASYNDLPLSRGRGGPDELDEVTVGIRPEHLAFSGSDSASGIEASIEQIEPMGRETLYVLDTPLGDLHLLESGPVHFAGGDSVRISWQPDNTLVFNNRNGNRIADAKVSLPG